MTLTVNGNVVFPRPGVDVRPELEHVPPRPRVGAGAVAVVHQDLERGQVATSAGGARRVRVVDAGAVASAAAVEFVFGVILI